MPTKTEHNHDNYAERALSLLKQKGNRITAPRRAVIQLLAETPAPLSAYDIHHLLTQKDISVDVASIYRILDCLEANQLIHKTFYNGKVFRCRLEEHHHDETGGQCLDHHDCHHSLFCIECGLIQEVHCYGMNKLMLDLEKQWGFRAEGHLLQITGLCNKCQSSKNHNA